MVETELVRLIKPIRINDIPMIISCSTFIGPSLFYFYKDDIIGSVLFFIVTGTSIMADGVYKNHLLFDIADICMATSCYIYAGISTLVPAYKIGYIIFSKQIVIYNIPLLFICQSRSQIPRSDSWRRWHMAWHYCASGLLIYSLATIL